jgi:hypothetical protein
MNAPDVAPDGITACLAGYFPGHCAKNSRAAWTLSDSPKLRSSISAIVGSKLCHPGGRNAF